MTLAPEEYPIDVPANLQFAARWDREFTRSLPVPIRRIDTHEEGAP